jgi:hypothetical protein
MFLWIDSETDDCWSPTQSEANIDSGYSSAAHSSSGEQSDMSVPSLHSDEIYVENVPNTTSTWWDMYGNDSSDSEFVQSAGSSDSDGDLPWYCLACR